MFEKFLELDGVYHVPNIRKNFINVSLLGRRGYNIYCGSNKVVIIRHGQFIGRDFLLDGLYRLSVMPSFSNAISNSQIESCDPRHGRLGHVNKTQVKRLYI